MSAFYDRRAVLRLLHTHAASMVDAAMPLYMFALVSKNHIALMRARAVSCQRSVVRHLRHCQQMPLHGHMQEV